MEIFFEGLVGLLAGLLGGLMGVGGSLIVIPALVIYAGYFGEGYGGSSQHLFQAAAMITNVFVAGPSTLAHYRARAILPEVVRYLVPASLLGIVLGVYLSNTSSFARENGVYLGMLLAAFLVYVVVYNSYRLLSPLNLEADFHVARLPGAWQIVAVGLPTGLVAGLLGIGGGAISVPMQQILLRLPLRRAIANSAVTIICVSFFGALYKNATLGQHGVAWGDSLRLAAALIPTAMVGSYIGARLVHALPRKALRGIFVAFMLSIALLTLHNALAALRERAELSFVDVCCH